MAKQSRVINTMTPLVLHQEDDLDLWEVVNPSDGEYSDESFSVDSLSDDDVISLDNASFVSPSAISSPTQVFPGSDGDDFAADLDLEGHDVDGNGDCDGDDAFLDGRYRFNLAVYLDLNDHIDGDDFFDGDGDDVFLDGGSHCSVGITYGDYVNDDISEEDRVDDEDDGDDYEDSYDLDEELVLENVRRKVGRQRMRKIGNRAITKVKTCPYSHLKPTKLGLCKQFRCY